jgi:hypothetical protein
MENVEFREIATARVQARTGGGNVEHFASGAAMRRGRFEFIAALGGGGR